MRRLALSLKQPWAALLASGRKSIEVRKWTTDHRGELLIHAARVDDPRPEAWAHVDPEISGLAALRGGIIGVGNLREVKAYKTTDLFVADEDKHLNEPDWFEPCGLFGFRFDGLRVIPFYRVPGFFKLFEVDIEVPPVPEQAYMVPPLPEQPAIETAPAGPFAAVIQRFRRLVRTLSRTPEEK